jgi:GNAT superfamily N-acetyltransferase
MPRMKYRLATANDVSLLAAMNHQLIRDEGHRNSMSGAELEGRMRTWLDGEYQAVLFEDDEGVAGYALFKREPEWIYLRQFFVEPARRRQGIGRTAIRWLLANFWNDDPHIRLEVLVGNREGIEFWRSLGFNDYCITMERPANQGAEPA